MALSEEPFARRVVRRRYIGGPRCARIVNRNSAQNNVGASLSLTLHLAAAAAAALRYFGELVIGACLLLQLLAQSGDVEPWAILNRCSLVQKFCG